MTVSEYCRHETGRPASSSSSARAAGRAAPPTSTMRTCSRLPGDIARADVIESSHDYIKVLDPRGGYVSVPCTYLDIE